MLPLIHCGYGLGQDAIASDIGDFADRGLDISHFQQFLTANRSVLAMRGWPGAMEPRDLRPRGYSSRSIWGLSCSTALSSELCTSIFPL
jgi:hypothetical protein